MNVICRDLTIVYPSDAGKIRALEDVNLRVRSGEFVSVVGPSGCGKTTLLRAIAGFLKPDSGLIERSASCGRTLLVYQENSLFPWMNVLENACFGLEAQGVPLAERESRALPLLRHFGLEGRERAWPHQLSMGMKQRVAVIRSFISDPDLLLMDEPFAAVDYYMRLRLQQELLEMWEYDKKTVLFVTHDVNEALLLSDRVIVMSATPGTVIAEIPVPFPRPRDLEVTLCGEWLELKRQVFQKLGIPLSESAYAG
jgi:NitT/TauT family transport system ATP-binding protein